MEWRSRTLPFLLCPFPPLQSTTRRLTTTTNNEQAEEYKRLKAEMARGSRAVSVETGAAARKRDVRSFFGLLVCLFVCLLWTRGYR